MTAVMDSDTTDTADEWKNGVNAGDEEGQVTLAEDGADGGDLPEGLPIARVKDGETRSQCWERLRREFRAAGFNRRLAYEYATREIERIYPVVVVAEAPDPVEAPPADLQPTPEPPPADPAGSTWLSEIPADWPVLPANASLLAEVSWVQANRLRVKDGERVDLTRALSPAPSHSALSWLETAIAFPAKWADVTVRATQNQEDETGATRRERAAVDEIASLLDATLEELSS